MYFFTSSISFGIPFVFTGHSLGREKKRRLLQAGMDHLQIENNYSISRRIEAEELALTKSNLVITSTLQESTVRIITVFLIKIRASLMIPLKQSRQRLIAVLLRVPRQLRI